MHCLILFTLLTKRDASVNIHCSIDGDICTRLYCAATVFQAEENGFNKNKRRRNKNTRIP